MANPQRNERAYKEIANQLENLARGEYDSAKVARAFNKAYILFSNGFKPKWYPEGKFAGETAQRLVSYCDLLSKRKKVMVEGGEREMATEPEALDALFDATYIAHRLVPLFGEGARSFSDKIFNDIYNLSLSYMDAIVGAVADEYLGPQDAFDAKHKAVELAKAALRTRQSYIGNGSDDSTKLHIKRLEERLKQTSHVAMRPSVNVFTTRKSMYKKEELMDKLSKELTVRDDSGRLIYSPSIIFPIAHGGSEFGVFLADAYERDEHHPHVYPLMFSMKTRKHRHPWVAHDSEFLRQSMEGKDVLIVEDWVTSGNTVRGITAKLEEVFPREIRIATIKRDKEKSKVPILDKYQFYIGQWAIYDGGKTDSLSDMDKP